MTGRDRTHSSWRLVTPLLAAVLVAASALAAGPAMADGFSLFPPRPHHDHTIRTRVLPWTGGDRLHVAIGADVAYVQGPTGKVVITGPADLINDIVVDNGVIRRDEPDGGWRWWAWGRGWESSRGVTIVVTAPHIGAAGVSGSGRLTLGRLTQDNLDLSVSGSGSATASGAIKSLSIAVSGSGGVKLTQLAAGDIDARLSGSGWIAAFGSADTLHLVISGSGHADMASLALQQADAVLSGSGSAVIAPKKSADVHVSGSGTVRLATEPAQLNSSRSGSGAIIRPTGRE